MGGLAPHRGHRKEAGFHQEQAKAGVGGLQAERPLGLVSVQADAAEWSSPSPQGPKGVSVFIIEPKLGRSAKITCVYGDHEECPFSAPRGPAGTHVR